MFHFTLCIAVNCGTYTRGHSFKEEWVSHQRPGNSARDVPFFAFDITMGPMTETRRGNEKKEKEQRVNCWDGCRTTFRWVPIFLSSSSLTLVTTRGRELDV